MGTVRRPRKSNKVIFADETSLAFLVRIDVNDIVYLIYSSIKSLIRVSI